MKHSEFSLQTTPTDAAGRPTGFKPSVASEALADALEYLKSEWKWNGSEIARVLHIPSRTVNFWLKKRRVPISGAVFSPETQAVIHLVAIHRSLGAMFSDPFHQREWLLTKHPDLGKPPQEKMAESMEGLILVRQYLDFVRGRGA